jgi:hypothetical protein
MPNYKILHENCQRKKTKDQILEILYSPREILNEKEKSFLKFCYKNKNDNMPFGYIVNIFKSGLNPENIDDKKSGFIFQFENGKTVLLNLKFLV